MKAVAVVVLTMMMVNAAMSEPQGSMVNKASARSVTGGCTVTNWTEGKKKNGSEVCANCSGSGFRKCDTTATDSSCVDLAEGDAETECGTCQESCGGTEKRYSSNNPECSGTFTTSSCGRTYVIAEQQ